VTDVSRDSGVSFWRFVAESTAAAGALAAVGYYPTVRLAGEGSVSAMLAGCAITLVGSIAGGALLLFAKGRTGSTRGILGSTGIRFGVVLALSVWALLSGWFARRPLLAWLAISYAALLVVDTRLALRVARSSGKGNGS
jgi:hypothetical protein